MMDDLHPRDASDAAWARAGDAAEDQPKPNGHDPNDELNGTRADPHSASDQPNPNENGENSHLICEAADPHEIVKIPPRRWAYGKFLLFGEVGAIGAVDGGGKSAHATLIALSMLTGMGLLGE